MSEGFSAGTSEQRGGFGALIGMMAERSGTFSYRYPPIEPQSTRSIRGYSLRVFSPASPGRERFFEDVESMRRSGNNMT
jgi:hypothetical protein